jgi:hypothetical protein
MRSVVSAILLLALFAPRVSAQDNSEPDGQDRDFETLFEYYYLRKNTNDVVRMLKSIQTNKLFDEHESAAVGFAAFLSIVFSENPDKIDEIVKSAKCTGKLREAVQKGLWMSGNAEKIAELFGKVPKFAAVKPVGPADRPLKEPGDLDMMWNAFAASGDASYAKRVMEVLDESREITGDKKFDAVMRGAAEWSLGSFVRRHELVHRMVRKELKSQPDEVKKKLRKMLSQIKLPTLEKSDGELTAGLFIMDDAALQEFKKPSDEALHLTEKEKARVGDIVAIKIMFTGIKLADDLKALVDYDLQVLDPDGEFYDETDLNHLEALHGKVGNRFTFFDNEQTTMLRFEPKDKLGTYTVRATIRDRIGKKSVSLEKKITLSK